MSGEISVKERNLKKELLALAIIFAVAFAATSLILRLFNMGAAARNAAGALIAYIIARVGYGLLNPGGAVRRIAWELTDAALVLDGKAIPRESIRAVHCWANRDAFGHARPGWTVNIETGRNNALLRSIDGAGAEQSAKELETLVYALGGQVPAS